LSNPNPYKQLACRYFSSAGYGVFDDGDTATVIDANGDQLRLHFLPDVEDGTGSSQYFGPGSKVFEQVLTEVRSKGKVLRIFGRFPFNEKAIQAEMRTWVLESSPGADVKFLETRTNFLPTLLLNFKIAYVTDEKREELICLAINLSTGKLYTDYINRLSQLSLSSTPPMTPLTRRRVSCRKAYGMAKTYIGEHIARRDKSWIDEAVSRLDAEIRQLDAYFEGIIAEAGDDFDKKERLRQEKEKYVNEQKLKFNPRVSVDLINLGLVYIPHLSFRVAVGNCGDFRVSIDPVSGERQITPIISGETGIVPESLNRSPGPTDSSLWIGLPSQS
jgi:hypothetical protein